MHSAAKTSGKRYKVWLRMDRLRKGEEVVEILWKGCEERVEAGYRDLGTSLGTKPARFP